MCATLLERLPRLGLPDWWLTAGAVFQNVWNHVEEQPAGYGIKDYDVFYFDDTDVSWEAEDAVIRGADVLLRDLSAHVEIRNEARVHLWYEEKFGIPARPFADSRDAISSFASTTCCVAVTNGGDGVEVFAPWGLDDVFAMHMRPHRRLAPRSVYESKVAEYRRRWPSVTHDPW